MNGNISRKPIVLEKIQLESRKVFSSNNRKFLIDERKSNEKNFKDLAIKENSFYRKRIKLISELPPHPRKVILPIIENQIVFISGVLLTLLHRDVVGNFKKSMTDFFILRSIFSIGVFLFLIIELYTLNLKINNLNKEKINENSTSDDKKLFFLSKDSIKLLILWMLISSLITISQPLIERILTIQMISLCQPFTPLMSLIIFLLITYKSENNKISFENTRNKINLDFLNIEKHEIVKSIKNEADKLNQRTRMITDNKMTLQRLSVILLSFLSLFIGTPIKEIFIHIKNSGASTIILYGILTALILPCLYDILFHLICNKIVKELLYLKNNDLLYDFDNSLRQDIKKRICNVYIHLFMTLGQIFIVLPVCLIIKIYLSSDFNNIVNLHTNTNIKNLFSLLFEIDNKEILIVIFSSISMIGIYQRYKINNAETYGITGLIAVQGFQTLLSTSMKYEFSSWLNNNLISLLLSTSSIFLLKLQDIKGILKLIYFYFKWILYYKNEVKDKFDYIYEKDYFKYYKPNIRIIGGTFDVNWHNNNTSELNKLDKNISFIEDDVSLKTDDETENLIQKKDSKNLTNCKNDLNKSSTKINKKYMKIQDKSNIINTPIMSAKVVFLQNK